MNKTLVLDSLTDRWAWQDLSACLGMSVDVFYSADHFRGSRKREHEARAKAVCATCPVVAKCLGRALKVGELYGVWGGLTARERDARRDAHSVVA